MSLSLFCSLLFLSEQSSWRWQGRHYRSSSWFKYYADLTDNTVPCYSSTVARLVSALQFSRASMLQFDPDFVATYTSALVRKLYVRSCQLYLTCLSHFFPLSAQPYACHLEHQPFHVNTCI